MFLCFSNHRIFKVLMYLSLIVSYLEAVLMRNNITLILIRLNAFKNSMN